MNKRAWYSIFAILIVIAIVAWLSVLIRPSPNLKIIACDVGQGDATLIIKGKFQMLIDGGPNNRVLSCLGKYVPFWDRNIEVVVLTHPDADHYVGLIEVFKRYHIKNFIATEAGKENESYKALSTRVSVENSNFTFARVGNKIRYGDISIDILSPSNEKFLLPYEEEESNSYSVVMELSYGNFDALITGDLTPDLADLLATGHDIGDVEYLQVPHHGSKNGLTKKFLDAASPEIAVISAGKNNRYGHPHEEIIKLLADEGIKTLRTYEVGDIIIESDGVRWKSL